MRTTILAGIQPPKYGCSYNFRIPFIVPYRFFLEKVDNGQMIGLPVEQRGVLSFITLHIHLHVPLASKSALLTTSSNTFHSDSGSRYKWQSWRRYNQGSLGIIIIFSFFGLNI